MLAAPGISSAGSSCCACATPCAPGIAVIAPPAEFYVVDQGPTYSGPGLVRVPGVIEVNTMPAAYPYVGRDYYFPGYPDYRYVGVRHVERFRHRLHRRNVHRRHVEPHKLQPLEPGDQ
jgi:hypothetical protein